MFAVALFILFGIGLITWVMTKSVDYLMDENGKILKEGKNLSDLFKKK